MNAVTESQLEEYDSFGPWVTRVAGADEIPSLFAPHTIDFDLGWRWR
jgi:hypothetical protein